MHRNEFFCLCKIINNTEKVSLFFLKAKFLKKQMLCIFPCKILNRKFFVTLLMLILNK